MIKYNLRFVEKINSTVEKYTAKFKRGGTILNKNFSALNGFSDENIDDIQFIKAQSSKCYFSRILIDHLQQITKENQLFNSKTSEVKEEGWSGVGKIKRQRSKLNTNSIKKVKFNTDLICKDSVNAPLNRNTDNKTDDLIVDNAHSNLTKISNNFNPSQLNTDVTANNEEEKFQSLLFSNKYKLSSDKAVGGKKSLSSHFHQNKHKAQQLENDKKQLKDNFFNNKQLSSNTNNTSNTNSSLINNSTQLDSLPNTSSFVSLQAQCSNLEVIKEDEENKTLSDTIKTISNLSKIVNFSENSIKASKNKLKHKSYKKPSKVISQNWTTHEDFLLINLSKSRLANKWKIISDIIGTKTQNQCVYRLKRLALQYKTDYLTKNILNNNELSEIIQQSNNKDILDNKANLQDALIISHFTKKGNNKYNLNYSKDNSSNNNQKDTSNLFEKNKVSEEIIQNDMFFDEEQSYLFKSNSINMISEEDNLQNNDSTVNIKISEYDNKIDFNFTALNLNSNLNNLASNSIKNSESINPNNTNNIHSTPWPYDRIVNNSNSNEFLAKANQNNNTLMTLNKYNLKNNLENKKPESNSIFKLPYKNTLTKDILVTKRDSQELLYNKSSETRISEIKRNPSNSRNQNAQEMLIPYDVPFYKSSDDINHIDDIIFPSDNNFLSSKTFINDKLDSLECIIEDPFYSASNSLHDNIFGSSVLNSNLNHNLIKNAGSKSSDYKEVNLENANEYCNLCFSDDDKSIANSNIERFHYLNYNRSENNLMEEDKSEYENNNYDNNTGQIKNSEDAEEDNELDEIDQVLTSQIFTEMDYSQQAEALSRILYDLNQLNINEKQKALQIKNVKVQAKVLDLLIKITKEQLSQNKLN